MGKESQLETIIPNCTAQLAGAWTIFRHTTISFYPKFQCLLQIAPLIQCVSASELWAYRCHLEQKRRTGRAGVVY